MRPSGSQVRERNARGMTDRDVGAGHAGVGAVPWQYSDKAC